MARIVSISNSGEVIVRFNKTMTVPSMYANVSQRRFEPDYNETIHEFISLKVISGVDDLNPNRTSIVKFNLTDFQASFIQLQVEF